MFPSRAKPVIHDLIDLVPIDRQRQGAAKADVLKQFCATPESLAFMIWKQGDVSALGAFPKANRIVVTFFAFLQKCVVVQANVPGL